jgi:hypothetical protein
LKERPEGDRNVDDERGDDGRGRADAADLELVDTFDNSLSVFHFCKLPGMRKKETAKRVFHRTLWARDVARGKTAPPRHPHRSSRLGRVLGRGASRDPSRGALCRRRRHARPRSRVQDRIPGLGLAPSRRSPRLPSRARAARPRSAPKRRARVHISSARARTRRARGWDAHAERRARARARARVRGRTPRDERRARVHAARRERRVPRPRRGPIEAPREAPRLARHPDGRAPRRGARLPAPRGSAAPRARRRARVDPARDSPPRATSSPRSPS